MLIRQATEDDINAIMELYSGTVREVNSKDYDEAHIEVWAGGAFRPHVWKKKIDEQYFLVAEIENDIAGFGSIAKDGYIDFMYIHKDFQRKGIAKSLLKRIEEKGSEQNNAELYSHVSNTAKGFFEKYGYKHTGDQIDPVGEIVFINNIMRKKL